MPKVNRFSLLAALLVVFILLPIQLFIEKPLILAERFVKHFGFIEILVLAVYAYFLSVKLQNVCTSAKWRIRSWLLFSTVFFAQLLLGIFADSRFLMTGELHFPIPALIAAGPIYRMQLSFMPILFLSTVLITGPAWCSQLCYFGALDAYSAQKSGFKKPKSNYMHIVRNGILIFIIIVALLFRLLQLSSQVVIIAVSIFGIVGLAIILFFSRQKGKMIHCTRYCPIGVLVSYLKYTSVFRFTINSNCTSCMACIPACKYDALNIDNIRKQKPGITCTMCGDCIQSCNYHAFEYKILSYSNSNTRNIYLMIVIALHVSFIALARI